MNILEFLGCVFLVEIVAVAALWTMGRLVFGIEGDDE